MKKSILIAILSFLFILTGCQSSSYSINDGRYALSESEADSFGCPLILVKDGNLVVVQDVTMSYEPSGSFTIDRKKVVMETEYDNESCKWTFILIGDNTMKFSLEKSNIPSAWDNWKDGMCFTLVEE